MLLFLYLHEHKEQTNMKKFLLIILIACASIANAAQMKHFHININDSIICEEIVSYFSEWFNLPNNTSFVQAKVLTDNNGKLHYRYDQYIGDILVEGGQILVHSYNGYVQDINGVVLESDIEQSPVKNKIIAKKNEKNQEDAVIISINNESEFRYAYKLTSEELGAHVYIDTENGDTLKVIPFIHTAQSTYTTNTIYYGRRQLTVDTNGKWRFFSTQNPRIETIESTNQDISTGTEELYNTLISLCNTYYEEDKDSLNSYIASINFKLNDNVWWGDIEENSTFPDLYIKITNSSGEVIYISNVYNNWDRYSVTFNPMLLLDGSKYTIRLYDEDLLNDDEGGGFTISATTKGIGTISTTNFDVTVNITGNPIRDAHWGMEKTLEFYKNVLDRDSYDGKGATIYQFINPFYPTQLPNQAFARNSPPYCMVYGLGDGIDNAPMVALDIMSHEFSHLVTIYNSCNGLEYKGESGALNEGFSDIFAVLTEGYTFGEYDWTIGEKYKLSSSFSRSLKEPKKGHPEQPTTYGKGAWADPNNNNYDHGGVHINSSILSHMFYLLCQGGIGVNDNQDSYNVQGIGIDKATEIVYNTWINRLTYRSTFADARESFIQEVTSNSKYGKGSAEHKAVVNAWHAVGVGDKYVEEPQNSNLKPGKYVIVANREEDSKNNWYYMTSDLGTASTKRFQAISTGKENIDEIATSNLDAQYIWELEADGSNWKLKNGYQYITWKSGNSANLDAVGKSLTFDITDNQVIAHFNDGSAERYLSLHVGNDYFAFYANTGQIEQLYFLPYEDNTTPPTPERECKSVPYTETFASSQGDFTVYNAVLPSGFSSIWNWDSRYGMVAKCIKGSTKYASEAYLISPCIELPENENCVLTFSHAAKFFQDTKQMSLWISTNYDETNPELADWDRLVIPSYPTGDNWNWFESGAIDLSKYSGQNVNIAFGYTSTESYAPQWEIKNFAIQKTTTTDLEDVKIEQLTTTKILRNGQLLILRDGKTYNVMGQEVGN